MDSQQHNSTVIKSDSITRPHWLRRNLWSFLTLIVVIGICWWLVQHFKKPGQMSVIESRAMDMSAMQPTRRAVPVALATLKGKQIEGTVTYTGSVKLAKAQISSAEEDYRLLHSHYDIGKSTALEQFDAAVKLFRARLALTQAIYNYRLAQTQIVWASGSI